MKFRYSFRHMDSSNALMYYFEEKMSTGMEALIQTSSPINVTFIVENGEHKIHVELLARNHALIEVTEASEEMHKTIDLCVDTISKMLTREKSKQTHHHVKMDRFEAALAASTLAAADVAEDDADLEGEEDSLRTLPPTP